jgi:uracil-DNA glycosylase
MSQHTVTLAGETDWPGFRREARALLAALVPPEHTSWYTRSGAEADLFANASAPADGDPTPSQGSGMQLVVPASFLSLCETVILHQDPSRFGLLYRLLWRLVHEPGLRHDPLDADRVRAQHMAQAVRRDMHKMKAFVRFRTVEDGAEREEGSEGPEGAHAGPLHVAWFEPDHHIVEAVAPFFTRRFTQMRWAILTPERSIRWNGEVLELGPGGRREQAPPPDAGEALWLTYYRHIFNPARLKLAMMQKEMPRKYWRNLPEAAFIAPLASEAAERSARMIEAPATVPARRIAIKETAMHATAETPELPDDPEQALAALRAATDRCRECPIGEHATQSVFGEGPVRAAIMVVGEQPGDQEDLQGRPFVGPSGRLFDRAVSDLGWQRPKFYVTNAVKHFKFELRGKRRMHKTPAQREVAACLHWLESEIAQVRPRAFIALGGTAAHALLGRHVAVMRERGQWHTDARGLPVLVTLHPSALLRGDPAEKEAAYAQWLDDLSLAGEYLGIKKGAVQKR